MSERKYKVIKPFYCFHPEIIFDGKPRPAFYGVEWTVVVKDNPRPQIATHYQKNTDTEEEALKALSELLKEPGEYGPWQEWDYTAWYLTPQYRKAIVERKKRII